MEARAPDFRTLYDEFAPRIRRYLARLVGEGEAEDLTQEVFARAHGAMATRRGDSLVSTWLYRIATNAAIDGLRAASRREVPFTASDLVDRLPPVHREVILLGELRDLRDQEIADALEITLEAAKMRLHRARGELRRLLQASCDLCHDEDNELACDRKPRSRS